MLPKKRGKLTPAQSSIVLNLKPLLAARNISTPFAYLLKLGISNVSAHKMLNNRSVQINFKQLTLLCQGLNCTPNELFALRKMNLAPTHALNALNIFEEKYNKKAITEWLQSKTLAEVQAMMAMDEKMDEE
jgi:DNA-binding Xre family transcriptional regulator